MIRRRDYESRYTGRGYIDEGRDYDDYDDYDESRRRFRSSNVYERRNNKFELFSGRLGSVNATKKDAEKLVDKLNKEFSGQIDFKVGSDKIFSIIGIGYDGEVLKYADKYTIKIYENKAKPKDKICVDFIDSDGKVIRSRKGIILSFDKIKTAVYSVIFRYSLHTEEKERKYRQDLNDWEAKKKKMADDEAERRRKINKDWDDQKSKDRNKSRSSSWDNTNYSRRDWRDFNDEIHGSRATNVDMGRL